MGVDVGSADSRGVILHVEDDESQRESLNALLKIECFEIHQAVDGNAAIELATSLSGKLDVLIVDYHLGHHDNGTEVAEELSRLMGHSVPTIMLTGDIANCEVPLLSNAPVWIASKPIDPRALLAGLPALVQFRRELSRARSLR